MAWGQIAEMRGSASETANDRCHVYGSHRQISVKIETSQGYWKREYFQKWSNVVKSGQNVQIMIIIIIILQESYSVIRGTRIQEKSHFVLGRRGRETYMLTHTHTRTHSLTHTFTHTLTHTFTHTCQ